MAKRPVHWYEGMFLKPQHFQASDRYFRERVRESEEWFHPYGWGLKQVGFDPEAVNNHRVALRSCQARFKDGTTLNIPDEGSVDPIDLREALANASETTVYLAIPSLQSTRANVDEMPAKDGPRYFIDTEHCIDENTGDEEDREAIEFRNVQARLLLSHLDPTGYEILPLARIIRSADENAPPRIDRAYVPPVLGLDVWAPLHEEVRSLHEQIGAWITQESDLLVGRKISFDSQVLGDADRVLRLSCLNTAHAMFQSIIAARGMHPIDMYRELCRLLGQLSIFGEKRRPPLDLPGYHHENIGPIYARVIQEIRKVLGGPSKIAYEKRYFQLEGKSFRVALEPDWTLDSSKLYVGVETTEMSDTECDELLQSTDWKLGSGEQVEEIFRGASAGLEMRPLNRIPPALPAGVVYFEIIRSPIFWKDVVRTRTLGLRFKSERCKFLSTRMLALTHPVTKRTVNLQFAVFVVKSA